MGFRVAALVLVPVLMLALVEVGLRVAGVGYPTSYFLKAQIRGEPFWVENKAFAWRFFPRDVSRSPTPTLMPRVKRPGTWRVFLFGESAALGDPRPAYGMGRYLEALLNERHPGARFEVVCVAVTAINSHAILPLAKECARRDGDFWVVYMGNNEMVGPFGACTVFGPQAPPTPVIRASLAVRRLRLGQLLADVLSRWTTSGDGARAWAGMRLFRESAIAPADPRRQRAHAHFRRNLAAILRSGRQAGVGVVTSTVVCNLKDCAPFASVHGQDLTADNLARWRGHYAAGTQRQSNGQVEEALARYAQAQAIDDQYAELAFRQGQSHFAQGHTADARANFQRALDLDALPFRAGSELNAIIRQVSAQARDPRVVLLDAEQAFSGATNQIPGRELFFEHVHFHFEGNYRVARAMAEQIEALLPRPIRESATAAWASQAVCDARLGLTDWNRAAVYQGVLNHLAEPPFVDQMNHGSQVQFWRERLAEIQSRLTPQAQAEAEPVYAQALALAPNDHRLRENYAEFLEATGDLDHAIQQWRQVQSLLPHHHAAFFYAGQLLARQQRYPEAETAFGQALRLRPDLAEAWIELGDLSAATGDTRQALERYQKAQAQRPTHARLCLKIADTLARADRRTEAMEQLRRAVALNPGLWEARYFLGVELAALDQVDEAERQFAEVVRLRPDYALAHLNLGVALAKQGKLAEARARFQETLRLDPDNRKARDYLEQLEGATRRPAP